jgi:hypothetical protein
MENHQNAFVAEARYVTDSSHCAPLTSAGGVGPFLPVSCPSVFPINVNVVTGRIDICTVDNTLRFDAHTIDESPRQTAYESPQIFVIARA